MLNADPLQHALRVVLRTALCAAALLLSPLSSASGTLSFSGVLAHQTCSVTASGAASGEGHAITLDFGDVPIAELLPPGIWVTAYGKNFTLRVSCPPYHHPMQVQAAFSPQSGSGLDHDEPSLLRLDSRSTARGIGIAIWNPSTAEPLDLSATPSLYGLFALEGDERVAPINVAALYTLTTGSASPGSGSAALPFMLNYE